jgi:hypothetical protein
MKLTEEERELLQGMIEVQKHYASRCRIMTLRNGGVHKMAEKQEQQDLKRVELLERVLNENS